jgi:hypothetical protein
MSGAAAESPPRSQVISGRWAEPEERQSKKDVREKDKWCGRCKTTWLRVKTVRNGQKNSLTIFAHISFYSVGNETEK